jgi:regulator of sigma E protease
VSWILAFLGFALLIIAHEAGHFTAAKAVGMRVERFFLFFPPKLWSIKRGETEYGVGAIPLGGFVKITGMNPEEEVELPAAANAEPAKPAKVPATEYPRSYVSQPVWKRIVVISAGPFVNLVIAFAILFGLGFTLEKATTVSVDDVEAGTPAATHLEPDDRVVSINGVSSGAGDPSSQAERLTGALDGLHCAGGENVDGCRATRAVPIVVVRDGQRETLDVRPFYDADNERFRFGFSFVASGLVPAERTVSSSTSFALDRMWQVTSATVGIVGRLFDAEQRKEISGVVGSYEVTRQSFEFDTRQALLVLALISLSLAVINLFPFLPLDGGHIFWAVVEKVRGRRVSMRTMERASVVGFALVLMLFAIGLTNDIGRLSGDGFDLNR